MILYNMRYRGPYEYDKTVLNVFQFHNEILSMTKELEEQNEQNIKLIQDKIETLFQELDSFSNRILLARERKSDF